MVQKDPAQKQKFQSIYFFIWIMPEGAAIPEGVTAPFLYDRKEELP